MYADIDMLTLTCYLIMMKMIELIYPHCGQVIWAGDLVNANIQYTKVVMGSLITW